MTETTTNNPLNIRAGDVIEYTGKNWSGHFSGMKQEVSELIGDFMHYSTGNSMELEAPKGNEYTVHYVARDGDRYHCSINDTIYTYKNGEPFFTSRMTGDDMKAQVPDWFLTSKNFKRLSSEPTTPKLTVKIAPAGADLNDEGQWKDITDAITGGDFSFTSEEEKVDQPSTKQDWVSVPGSDVEDGERVRIPGSRAIEYKVEGESISIASNVSVHVDHFEELEVLREVIELPTQFGHYESIHEGITYDLSEDGWSEMSGGECQVVLREQVEESAPLTRILTTKEADDQKQAAIAQQKEQYRSKRAQARSRFDAYQEELLDIIRRRNQEKIGLVEEIDRLRDENRILNARENLRA